LLNSKINELKNFSGKIDRKRGRKRKNPENHYKRHTITVPPRLDRIIEEERGEKSYSTYVVEQLMKVIPVGVET